MLQVKQAVLVQNRLQSGLLRLFSKPVHNLNFLIKRRIIHVNLQQETVRLSFRQRISTFLLYRVLRGKNEKRFFQLERRITNCNLVLLHSLKQSRLSLRSSSVDFIRQNNIRKNRARLELEITLPSTRFLDDVRTCNIRRHQVRSVLNTRELQIHQLRKSLNSQSLGKTRITLQ